MKKMLITILIILSLVGCTSKDDANKALQSEGFTNIEITGYNFFTCTGDEMFHTGFKATNAEGNMVTGTVCSSWFIGSTIRY